MPVYSAGQERIENVTYTPVVLLGGKALVHQFILKQDSAAQSASHIFPELGAEFDDINYCLNWTDGGYQNGFTYLELLKTLVEELDAQNITHTASKPFLLLTDGHKSRLTLPVLDFCTANGIE